MCGMTARLGFCRSFYYLLSQNDFEFILLRKDPGAIEASMLKGIHHPVNSENELLGKKVGSGGLGLLLLASSFT